MSPNFNSLLILCGWWPVLVMAQSVEVCRVKTRPGPYLRFDKFTVNSNEFKQSTHKSLQLQDSRGYLWFIGDYNGAHQLIRYDGTYYKLFGGGKSHYSGSNDAGDGMEVGLVKENQDHEIWVATENGLSRFDAKTETFTAFRNPYTTKQTIDYWVMGQGGQQWFSTRETPDKRLIRSFFAFNSRTRRVRKISPVSLINGYTRQTESTQPISFRPKAVDETGRVWGDINTGIPTLGYYDPLANILVWYPLQGFLLEKSVSLHEKLYNLSTVRPEGQYVWVGTYSRVGLLRLDLVTGRWKQFYFSSALNRVYQIVPRNRHEFWLQTDSSLTFFNKKTETLHSCPGESGYDHNFPYVLGQHGTLWRGLYVGAGNPTLKVLHEAQQLFTFKGDSLDVFGLLHKYEHRLYFSYREANKHLVFAEYDEYTRITTPLYQLPLDSFLEQNFWYAVRDSVQQTMWLVGRTAQGTVFRFDGRSRQLRPVQARISGLPEGENQVSDYDDIRLITRDHSGNVWFPAYGEKHGGNLFKFDWQMQKFVGFRAGTHGLPVGQIRSIMADQQGQVWLGYQASGGVYRFNPMTNVATLVLKPTTGEQNGVIGIVDDPARQKIWIARNKDGIWEYDQRKKTARRISREEVYGDDYFGVTFHLTKSGLLWFKNYTGLVRLNPATGQLNRFGVEYDLRDFFNLRFDKSEDDEFFYGRFRFYDRDIRPDNKQAKVVFSFIKVFDKEYLSHKSLNYANEIALDYDQNFFSVGFSALSYFHPEKNQYAYQLVGFNKDWIQTGNNPIATFTNVPPGQYVLRIRGTNHNGLWSPIRNLSLIILPPFWQTGWFRALLLSLLSMVVFMLYRFQVERRTLKARLEAEEARRQQKEAELKEKEAAYQLKLSRTEMAALRSQMNPHFIFNCLNSIQYFTALHDVERTSDYLTRFSRLIRLVLENSKSDKVTLTSEIEVLRLYIEMEAMRFPQKLHYQINVDSAIDADWLQIPPLLLQPFVENAIWHGLMHKDEGGTVQVMIEQPHEHLLHVEITDDGVGRAKAAAYKSKSATKTKSFGMKITAERIDIINQLYQIQTQIQVKDLVNEQGQAIGTTVIVDIPI